MLTLPPTPPSRTDRATFASRAAAFVDWLVAFVAQLNAQIVSWGTVTYVNRGAWVTATAYSGTSSTADLVTESGLRYRCLVSHTSGTFATDLAAGKWVLHEVATHAELADSTGAALIKWISNAGGAVARWLSEKLLDHPSALDFMTEAQIADVRSYAGLVDVTAAVQAALEAYKHISLPLGRYKLATPLLVNGGMGLHGVSGTLGGFSGAGSFLVPTTVAIQTDDYEAQYIGFDLHNVGTIGGTLPIDLGLFHHVNITDCWIYNPSVGGIVIVRGEKQNLQNIRIDAASNVIFGMSLGRYAESLGAATATPPGPYDAAFFSPDGAWYDRGSIKNIQFQASSTGRFAYGIKFDILSGQTIDNIVYHGMAGGEVSAIYGATRMQQCTLANIAPDSCGSVGVPMTAVFDLPQALNCTFLSMSPSFGGNNQYTKGFSVGASYGSTWVACDAVGDNATQFGWHFPANAGQVGSLINCSGAFYHASANAGVRMQIVQIGCDFSDNNQAATAVGSIRNENVGPLLAAEETGATASDGYWGARFTNGGGSTIVPFYTYRNAAYVESGVSLNFTATSEATAPSIRTGAATPEGAITARIGSIFLRYDGGAGTAIYQKVSGTGNTGWTAIA